MQRYCHNCGDPVEEGEIFCDKCGTKVISENTDVNENEEYTGTGEGNGYTGSVKVNNGKGYSPYPGAKVKKPSVLFKFVKIITTIVGVLTIIIIILAIIGSFIDDRPSSNPSSYTKPPAENTNNNSNTNNTNDKPAADKALVTWTANLNANAKYVASEKKIYVDYSVTLQNAGSGKAANVNLYLAPVQNDANGAALGITQKTTINYNENIPEILAGETREVKTQFYYSNIEDADASQDKLQDYANRYIKLPVLVEWQENGVLYNQTLLAN